MAEQVDQLGAHGLERVAEPALLHRAGAGQRAFRRRVEEIEQALRLGERKLVVEKSALGEFARPGRARAERQAGAHDVLHDVRIAVAGNFHRVLAGVGMRRAPEGEHDVVERFALVRERAVDGVARLSVDLGVVTSRSMMARLSGPLRRMTASAATPGGVLRATMVSVVISQCSGGLCRRTLILSMGPRRDIGYYALKRRKATHARWPRPGKSAARRAH